ncbi:MAG: hypothetical protein LC754_12095 [Acidobacteria bacterium]|nr:hypothetical protein [Acidobacteriota bacterium]
MSDYGGAEGQTGITEISRKHPPTNAQCPACEDVGRKVERQTVLHHVRPEHLSRVNGEAYRFCATPSCTVVYYGEDGARFTVADVREPVTEKTSGDARPICYCFGFSEGDVRRELACHGAITIPQQISRLTKAAMCACEVRNPSGACCLGLVNKIVKQLADEHKTTPVLAEAHDCCAQ